MSDEVAADRRRVIAYVRRRYDDPEYPAPQPWPRSRKYVPGEPDWDVLTDPGGAAGVEEATFDNVDDALAWARERADHVLVYLGSNEDSTYSAGNVHLTQYLDGSGRPYPEWPPDNWPDYQGPEAETRRF